MLTENPTAAAAALLAEVSRYFFVSPCGAYFAVPTTTIASSARDDVQKFLPRASTLP